MGCPEVLVATSVTCGRLWETQHLAAVGEVQKARVGFGVVHWLSPVVKVIGVVDLRLVWGYVGEVYQVLETVFGFFLSSGAIGLDEDQVLLLMSDGDGALLELLADQEVCELLLLVSGVVLEARLVLSCLDNHLVWRLSW